MLLIPSTLIFVLSTVAIILIVDVDFIKSESIPNQEKHKNNSFTKEEIRAMDKMRTVIGQELYKDFMRKDEFIIRWIRDQNGDFTKAKDKLLKSLQWRKANAVDTVTNEDHTDIVRNCLIDTTGRDKDGRPILASGLGQCNLRKVTLTNSREKIQRALFSLMENLARRARETQIDGKDPQQVIIIADLNGFSLRQHLCLTCFQFFVTLFDTYVKNYPDLIKTIYIINAPRTAEQFQTIFAPLAPPNLREEFFLFGFDKKEWQQELFKKISPDQLNPAFGGKKAPVYDG